MGFLERQITASGVVWCVLCVSVGDLMVCVPECVCEPVNLFVVSGVLLVGPGLSLRAQDPGSVKNGLVNSQ